MLAIFWHKKQAYSQFETTETIEVEATVSVQWSYVYSLIIHQINFITWQKTKQLSQRKTHFLLCKLSTVLISFLLVYLLQVEQDHCMPPVDPDLNCQLHLPKQCTESLHSL